MPNSYYGGVNAPPSMLQATIPYAGLQQIPIPETIRKSTASPWQLFRASDMGRKMFGPTPAEQEAGFTPGGDIGIFPLLAKTPLAEAFLPEIKIPGYFERQMMKQSAYEAMGYLMEPAMEQTETGQLGALAYYNQLAPSALGY